MILCHKICPSYKETVSGYAVVLMKVEDSMSLEMKKKQRFVLIGFTAFLIGLVTDSVMDISGFSPYFLGHLSMIFSAKWQNFCARKNLMPMQGSARDF